MSQRKIQRINGTDYVYIGVPIRLVDIDIIRTIYTLYFSLRHMTTSIDIFYIYGTEKSSSQADKTLYFRAFEGFISNS